MPENLEATNLQVRAYLGVGGLVGDAGPVPDCTLGGHRHARGGLGGGEMYAYNETRMVDMILRYRILRIYNFIEIIIF